MTPALAIGRCPEELDDGRADDVRELGLRVSGRHRVPRAPSRRGGRRQDCASADGSLKSGSAVPMTTRVRRLHCFEAILGRLVRGAGGLLEGMPRTRPGQRGHAGPSRYASRSRRARGSGRGVRWKVPPERGAPTDAAAPDARPGPFRAASARCARRARASTSPRDELGTIGRGDDRGAGRHRVAQPHSPDLRGARSAPRHRTLQRRRRRLSKSRCCSRRGRAGRAWRPGSRRDQLRHHEAVGTSGGPPCLGLPPQGGRSPARRRRAAAGRLLAGSWRRRAAGHRGH